MHLGKTWDGQDLRGPSHGRMRSNGTELPDPGSEICERDVVQKKQLAP